MDAQSPRLIKERPIIFSAAMVRAILEGRKTQTRRIIKGASGDIVNVDGAIIGKSKAWLNGDMKLVSCPYGQPGDRLWVRETAWYDRAHIPGLDIRCFFEGGNVKIKNHKILGQGPGSPTCYTAEDFDLNSSLVKRPSIHMPRWASRITLEIVSVRVERVWEINGQGHHDDVLKEGWPWGREWPERNPYFDFRDMWNEINGTGSFERKPWVWVIEFKRVYAA